jgi:hypothetical protein
MRRLVRPPVATVVEEEQPVDVSLLDDADDDNLDDDHNDDDDDDAEVDAETEVGRAGDPA